MCCASVELIAAVLHKPPQSPQVLLMMISYQVRFVMCCDEQ